MVVAVKKGKKAEWIFATKLKQHLDIKVSRNLNQARNGGHDLLGLEPFAIEVKDQVRLCLPEWWKQAVRQAEEVNKKKNCSLIPMLAYNIAHKGWRIKLPLHCIVTGMQEDFSLDATVELKLPAFVLLYNSVFKEYKNDYLNVEE